MGRMELANYQDLRIILPFGRHPSINGKSSDEYRLACAGRSTDLDRHPWYNCSILRLAAQSFGVLYTIVGIVC